MEAPPVIDVSHLSIAFAGTPDDAVADLSFSLTAGKTLAVIGGSGSGISLIAPALAGLLPQAATWSGTITLRTDATGFTLRNNTAQDVWEHIRRKIVSSIYREPANALDPIMKVGRQLAEAIAAHGGGSGLSAKKEALAWLQKVQLPELLYQRYPHQLSGAQRQRVMIAMAMSSRPLLLIADESAGALDVMEQRSILDLLRTLQEDAGTAMIFITQRSAAAARLADEVLVMCEGRLLERGPAENVLPELHNPYIRTRSAGQSGAGLPVTSGSTTGTEIPPLQPTPATMENSGALLQVRHLRVWFPISTPRPGRPSQLLRAVEDISFDLHRGETSGIAGESGSGKSTVARALTGLQAVESGRMTFAGKDLAYLSAADWRAMRRKIQIIYPDAPSALDPWQTVGDALLEPLRIHRIVPRHDADREARRLLGMVQLPETAMRRYPRDLSVPERQRVIIARSLALRPQLVIYDEILSAVDLSGQAQLLHLLKDLQAELRLSYLFISRDLNAVRYMSDQVLIMQAGKIVERGSAEKVFQHPEHPYTQQFVAATL